ncbi:MAG TPA: FkbM family methyltransferase [Candidatus Acidoferrales bacterium]|nr:FkbM family methyltransferase [Candidatus Acidoferrales bacterium]
MTEYGGKWIGELALRAPAQLRALRRTPVLGGLLHRISQSLLPARQSLLVKVQEGAAQGIWLELNPRTGQDYLKGRVEPEVQRALAGRLKGGCVFYDLGANIGFFSLLAARLVGSRGRVYSFEPDAITAQRLRRNVAQNGAANVSVVEMGVWSSTKLLHFMEAAHSSPDRGTGFVNPSGAAGAAAIPCASLDDFCKGAPVPNAIKCDVEGAEMEVLRGAQRILAEARPWVICELHSPDNDREVRAFLRDVGYKLETLNSNHVLALP